MKGGAWMTELQELLTSQKLQLTENQQRHEMQTIYLWMCKTQRPRYSYNMLKGLQNSHNTSFLLVLVKLYIPVYNRNGKICNSVQSFKRLLKNGFLYFYATFIVLVSHFFISKFSVQVLSQDNLIYTLPEGTPSRIHRVLRWGAPTLVTNMHVAPHRLFALLS